MFESVSFISFHLLPISSPSLFLFLYLVYYILHMRNSRLEATSYSSLAPIYVSIASYQLY